MGTPATKATARYQAKKGLISKSYKLDKETVELFAEACEEAETSQAKELTKFMKRYITKHHPDFE
jgi:uncharacterized tellurite resistance protein B-like protein